MRMSLCDVVKILLQIKNAEKESGYRVDYYYNPIVKSKKDSPLTLYEGISSPSLARNIYGLKGRLSNGLLGFS